MKNEITTLLLVTAFAPEQSKLLFIVDLVYTIDTLTCHVHRLTVLVFCLQQLFSLRLIGSD